MMQPPPVLTAIIGCHRRTVLEREFRALPRGGRVVDMGCRGFGLPARCAALGRSDLVQYGVDLETPGEVPSGVVFERCDLNGDTSFEDGYFDAVHASHVIEHLRNPLGFFAECIRITKPGGIIYIEAPSERALLVPGMGWARSAGKSTSFYDDPTHLGRPWSAQGLHRLAREHGIVVLGAGNYVSWRRRLLAPLLLPLCRLLGNAVVWESTIWLCVGWASWMVARKPAVALQEESFAC